jgi:hypothetical protein
MAASMTIQTKFVIEKKRRAKEKRNAPRGCGCEEHRRPQFLGMFVLGWLE